MITINLDKAKIIGHDLRRQAREQEFRPYDEVIMKQIPGVGLEQAESARQAIREKYAQIQQQIDEAASPDEIKTVLGL
jgi:hypothetical protein